MAFDMNSQYLIRFSQYFVKINQYVGLDAESYVKKNVGSDSEDVEKCYTLFNLG